MEKYQLVVIGSGAGLNVLSTGMQMGLKCALLEDTKLGATCLTRGCIPSKILVHPADLIREAQHAKKGGAQSLWLATVVALDVYHLLASL